MLLEVSINGSMCDLDRKHLFSLINDLPTVFEAVSEWKPIKHTASMHSGSKSRTGTKVKQFNSLGHFLLLLFQICKMMTQLCTVETK